MTEQTEHRRVAIAGAGIGGLAAALALARVGFQVDIFEKRDGHLEEGAGIQIGPNGSRILSALGVARYCEDKLFCPESLVIHDGPSGDELSRFPLGDTIAERFGSPYWTIHRHHLHKALLSAAEEQSNIRVSFSSGVQSFAQDEQGVHITTHDRSEHRTEVLIGADGLWSRLRHAICPGFASRPTGKSAYRTVTQQQSVPRAVRDDNVHIWLFPSRHCVHYPVDGGRATACVFIFDHSQNAQDWNAHADPAILDAKFADAPREVTDLISSCSDWRSWSLQTMTPLPSWISGRAALIGDAAHPILPFMAQGAVMALEDSVVLAQCLARCSRDVNQGLQDYEAMRQGRLDAVARASSASGKIYQMSGLAARARNTALRTMPPHLFMRRYDWLYGWQHL